MNKCSLDLSSLKGLKGIKDINGYDFSSKLFLKYVLAHLISKGAKCMSALLLESCLHVLLHIKMVPGLSSKIPSYKVNVFICPFASL
jgi:hypothetical protein